jgi:flagellar hook-basal body complex protein FliE
VDFGTISPFISNPYLSNNNRMVSALATVGSTLETRPVLGETAPDQPTFANLLTEALGGTALTDAAVKSANLGLFADDNNQDIHDLTIASTQADIMLNLTVQIRNRMIEGYQEIMRMQI